VRDKDKLASAKMLFYASIVCVVLAFIGSVGVDLWLASTQWVLVSVLLALWAVYLLSESQFKV